MSLHAEMTGRPESVLVYQRAQDRCPLCPVVVQRTQTGTVADGMAAHRLAVHKGEETARG